MELGGLYVLVPPLLNTTTLVGFDQIINTVADNSPLSWTPTTVWESKIKDIVWEQDDNQPRFRHFVWQNVFQEANMDALFRTPLQEQLIPFTVYLSPDALWKRLRTISQIAVMEGELLDVSLFLFIFLFK